MFHPPGAVHAGLLPVPHAPVLQHHLARLPHVPQPYRVLLARCHTQPGHCWVECRHGVERVRI